MDVDELEKLKKEFAQLKSLWGDLSLVGKVLAGISLFFSASAVTSLSTAIADWKGFIKDGVEVYRQFVSEPLRALFAKFANFDFSQAEADVFTLAALVTLMLVRAFLLEMRMRWIHENSPLNQPFLGTEEMWMFVRMVQVCAATTGMAFSFGYEGSILSQLYALQVDWTSGALLIVFFLMFGLLIHGVYSSFYDETKKLLHLNIMVIVGFILVLGAINAGLTS